MLYRIVFSFLLSLILLPSQILKADQKDPEQVHFWNTVRPIFIKHCNGCHNGEDNKGGINLERFDFVVNIVRRGSLFTNVINAVQEGTMPPEIRPPMSEDEKDTMIFYINKYLTDALAEKDPGLIPPRRLNNQEYKYVVQDILDIEVNVDSIFPSDPSGGAGFDNQAAVLYFSPILMERYFETGEFILDQLYQDQEKWRKLVPKYKQGGWGKIRDAWYSLWNKDNSYNGATKAAEEVIFPIAIKAYRKFLTPEEKSTLIGFFNEVYQSLENDSERFDLSIKETLKVILVSHNFLYRQEADPNLEGSYQISNFELASRLSFFLWSSIPDQELLNVAYRGNLHDSTILKAQVQRMLQDPKANRLGERFAVQWLELSKLNDPAFQLDPEIYPEYNTVLKDIMLQEAESFFNYVILNSQNFLELIDSDYTFLNEPLADFYEIEGIQGDDMQMVCLDSSARGGVMGMAGVLVATSMPTRTSPVLRGKWVLEQILGTPAKAPPADVPELEESKDGHNSDLSLRELLMVHRDDPACRSCHEVMDPLGLGLENFDGMGRWRTSYDGHEIDASGVLKSGEEFNGPSELKKILLTKKKLFAKNLSTKMLSFALGRSLQFKDTPTINHLTETLLQHDFNTQIFLQELIFSFPFRYKKSDNLIKAT